MNKLNINNGIKFSCQSSGNCCVSRGKHGYVYLSKKDLKKLSSHFNIEIKDFTIKYCSKTDGLIHLKELKNENLIAFKYCDKDGKINENSNPNGSLENIAGIFNSKKNILGMMPHPERMVDNLISNTDGVNLFSSLLK